MASRDFLDTVSLTTGIATTRLESERVELPWLRLPSTPPTTTNGAISADSADSRLARRNSRDERSLTRFNPVAPTHVATLAKLASTAPFQAVKLTSRINNRYVPPPTFEFCIPLNLILKGLRLRTEVKLFYLRTCRNFAGMKRQVEPYAAPTDAESGLPTIGAGGQLVLPGTVTLRPTSYRYSFLIERAKELVQLADQIESGMLSALEKRDAEYYNLLRARQDVQMSRAPVQLQELRVQQAEQEVGLAQLQKQGTQLRVDQYQALIDAGLNQSEQQMLNAYVQAAIGQSLAAVADTGIQIAQAFTTALTAGAATLAPALAAAAGVSLLSVGKLFATRGVIRAEQEAQTASIYASLERRQEEWELQKSIAKHDVMIGAQQIRIAQNQVRVAGQEHNIAKLETDYPNEPLEFLRNKFTNVELYDWMSSVLEGVYSYFLQQATAVAKLAENQLAFERQEVPPAYIQADYWVLTEGGVGGTLSAAASDRRGLTGSARLLQDIYKLNQYALETNQRKLQLTQTFSLAQLFPIELQQLRQTGVITFETPMELFDRKFPGHYLRLIKQVRTSVIALIPPAEGIHATLSTGGLSRVVIGGNNGFQKVNIQRPPESVALTSPINATGLFELNPAPELLLPFEGIGVDTFWELRMPKAANLFDYRTIADILITIEYTALNSYDYRQQVILTLDNKISADRSFSFRNQFADAWYDLHNPEQTNTPMVICFKTERSDFPPNVEDLKIQQLLLYFALSNGNSFEVSVTHLHFTEKDGIGTVGGGATSIDGLTSTRKGNGSSWTSILGKTLIGEWELALPNTEEMKNRFKDEKVEAILFVITYSSRTPEWPI